MTVTCVPATPAGAQSLEREPGTQAARVPAKVLAVLMLRAKQAGVLSGAGSLPFAPDDYPDGPEALMSRVVLMRLRQLVARHPGFTAE